MSCDFICIEGVIGSGKTSLAKMLSADLGAHLVLESFEENSFLPKFYLDKERYAFPLEMSFLADRYHQIQEFEQTNDEKMTISDYYITKSKVFASVNLEGEEAELFGTVYNVMLQKVLKPKLVVYLQRPVKQLIKNISGRGRAYEQEITEDYLNTLQTRYLEQFETEKLGLTVLILNLGEGDFVNDRALYSAILKSIGKQRLKGIYQETI